MTISAKVDGAVNYFKGGGFKSDVKSGVGRLGDAIKKGGESTLESLKGRVFNTNFADSKGQVINPEDDWRVRISMSGQARERFYWAGTDVLEPINATNGVIFPFTPQIQFSHSAKYGVESLMHTNYSSVYYQSSDVSAISITGDFSVQSIEDGRYLMATIHFFRAVTKMFYGQDQLAGTPPPLVFLDGYGKYYLPHIPCVVTSFTHTLPADVDYLAIPYYDESSVRLPTISSVAVTLQPVYSRQNIYDNFNNDDYVRMNLAKDSKSDTGGFI